MSAYATNEDGVALASSTASATSSLGDGGDGNAAVGVSVNLAAVTAAALVAGGMLAW